MKYEVWSIAVCVCVGEWNFCDFDANFVAYQMMYIYGIYMVEYSRQRWRWRQNVIEIAWMAIN